MMRKKISTKLPIETYNHLKSVQQTLSREMGFPISLGDAALYETRRLQGMKETTVKVYGRKKKQLFEFNPKL